MSTSKIACLKAFHPLWTQGVIQKFSTQKGMRADLQNQLDNFYRSLEQAVENNEPAWLDSILALWSTSLTRTDVEGHTNTLTQFIADLSDLTFAIARQEFNEHTAMEITSLLLPHFNYAFVKSTEFETQARTSDLTRELEEVRKNLNRVDRSKSDFIAVAAHELKTPLTLIEGYASMLNDSFTSLKLEEGSPEVTLLTGLRTGIVRMRNIIDDMIDVSMIDNGLMQLNFQPIWLDRLIHILAAELETTIQERGLTFSIEPFESFSQMTFGDPERIMQIFRHILHNSIKYTPDGGKITITGRKLPGFIEIIITDTGIGISQDQQEIVFEKFTRIGSAMLHSSGKTKFKGGGPGLGLHIAKGIVEFHGGTIWLQSPGYDEKKLPGTIVHVLLPLRKEPPDETTAHLFAPLIHLEEKESE
jgi:signal transduction histidine kinase